MSYAKYYDITPVSAPRQVRSHAWNPTDHVLKYRAFKDEVRLKSVMIPKTGAHIIFVLPMPKSWPAQKRKNMLGQGHQQKPDTDNLAKALLDAVFDEDCQIWDYRITKIWGNNGAIIVKESDQEFIGEVHATLARALEPMEQR